MNLVMHQAMGWCRQNRPALVAWMTLARFQQIMAGVVHVTWGMNGGKDWDAQNAFLHTEAGPDYFRRLGEGLRAHVAGLGDEHS